MPIVSILSPDTEPVRYSLVPGTYTIGRAPDASIRVEDPSVADRHCTVTVYETGDCVVRDMGSEAGLVLEGRRIGVSAMRPGQVLAIGRVALMIERETDPVPALEQGGDDDVGNDGEGLAHAGFALAPGDKRDAWLRAAMSAFGYPWRAHILMTVAFMTLPALAFVMIPPALGSIGFAIQALIGLYFFQLARDVLLTTAGGDDEPPPNPEIMTDVHELRARVMLYIGVGLASFGPFGMCQWFEGAPAWLVVGCAVYGLVYFPMALLGVAIADQPGPLLPTFVFQSIARIPGAYLLVVLGFTLLAAMGWATERMSQSGVAGPMWIVVLQVLAGGVILYLTLVWLRVLGLMFRFYRDRLGWEW
jgi:hypothetical protein